MKMEKEILIPLVREAIIRAGLPSKWAKVDVERSQSVWHIGIAYPIAEDGELDQWNITLELASCSPNLWDVRFIQSEIERLKYSKEI